MGSRFARPAGSPLRPAPGSPPSQRSGHVAVADSSFLYVHGGFHDGVAFTDLHKMHLATGTWTRVHARGEHPRATISQAGLIDGHNLLVFGGTGSTFGQNNSNELSALNVAAPEPEWRTVSCTGDVPTARYGHTFARRPGTSEVYLFGGTTGHHFLDDLYCLDLATLEWRKIEGTGDAPSVRYRHVGFCDASHLYILGGGCPTPCGLQQAPLAIEVFVYDIVANSWTKASCRLAPDCASYPSPRLAHSATFVPTLTPETEHDPLYASSAPPPESGTLLMYGGVCNDTIFGGEDGLWKLSVPSLTWSRTPLPDPGLTVGEGSLTGSRIWRPLYFHTCTLLPTWELCVFGGALDKAGAGGAAVKRTNCVRRMRVGVPPLLEMCIASLGRMVLDGKASPEHGLDEESLMYRGVPHHLVAKILPPLPVDPANIAPSPAPSPPSTSSSSGEDADADAEPGEHEMDTASARTAEDEHEEAPLLQTD